MVFVQVYEIKTKGMSFFFSQSFRTSLFFFLWIWAVVAENDKQKYVDVKSFLKMRFQGHAAGAKSGTLWVCVHGFLSEIAVKRMWDVKGLMITSAYELFQ